MFLFLETIKLLDGNIFHLPWHQNRIKATFQHFFKGTPPLSLTAILTQQTLPQQGLYKIRIEYNATQYQLSILPYVRKTIRQFQCIAIDFEYAFKFVDRKNILTYTEAFPQSEVIFTRNDFLLDSSYANLAFFDGQQWITPKTFLLNGTTRRRLLDEKKIIEKSLTINDIPSFEKISFLNALNDLNENVLHLR